MPPAPSRRWRSVGRRGLVGWMAHTSKDRCTSAEIGPSRPDRQRAKKEVVVVVVWYVVVVLVIMVMVVVAVTETSCKFRGRGRRQGGIRGLRGRGTFWDWGYRV